MTLTITINTERALYTFSKSWKSNNNVRITYRIYLKKCFIGKCNGKSNISQNDVSITCQVLNFLVLTVNVCVLY